MIAIDDAGDLAADDGFRTFLQTAGEPVVPHERRASTPSRPRSLWLAVALCVALLTVGGVTFAMLRGSPP